ANDSAPMHIACARGVPVVGVFCATTPALGYGPWGPRAAVVEADLACRPCARHGGRRCPRGTEDCMRLVAPATVLAAARAALGVVRPPLVAAIASGLEAPGARAYRIAQEVIAFGTTLRLRHAPVRLARRDGVRLRLRTGLTPELAAGGGRVPRLPERLVTN